VVLLEFVILAGKHGVEYDAHDSGDGKAGEADDAYLDAAGVGDADGKNRMFTNPD